MLRNMLRAPRLPLLLALWLAICLSGWPTAAHAGRSLRVLGLFPHPGLSHFDFFHPIMRGLAEAGHEVHVVSHFPDKSPPVRYKDYPLTNFPKLTNTVDLHNFERQQSFFTHFFEFFMLSEWAKTACNHTLRSDALAQVLRNKPGYYDVILVEQFNSDCMWGIAYQLRAPVIGLSSCALMPWHYDRFGAPIIPSYIPALFLGQSGEMNFGGRLANWITFHSFNLLYSLFNVQAADALLQYKFGHDIPSVGDLARETSLMFVNQHFSLSGARPLPPNIIELGGIHIKRAKPLPIDLQRMLDNANEHGVIVISWGSMIRASTLPAAKRDSLLRAVGRLKQKVIWKWENETLPNQPENMYIAKWLPQRDILCHPNVRAFMSHAGLMGTSESAYCGVPMLLTPMYGDQFLNAAAVVQRGMGVLLPFDEINENTLMRALKKVLDKSYAEHAKIVSHSYNHRPLTALQTAIWWVEYVAHTEGAPLSRPAGVALSRFVYYSLDVYAFFVVLTVLIIASWVWLLRKFCTAKSPKSTKIN